MSRPDGLLAGACAVLVACSATAAGARDASTPVAGRTPNVRDVAMTPLTDLNLASDPIPPVLLAAAASPYDVSGIGSCREIGSAIAALDGVLGPDMDVTDQRSERLSPGVVAKSVVASFIPFRGIVREVTGAADHQRQFEAAIYAGAVRRGFLKGLGQQKKCAYPARPAFVRVSIPTTGAPTVEEEFDSAAALKVAASRAR